MHKNKPSRYTHAQHLLQTIDYPLKTTRGFSLIELLVALSIIGLLSSILLASLSTARQSARDAARLSAMKETQTALELYNTDVGRYPDGDAIGEGGWDTPGNGTFIEPLVTGRMLPVHIKDPIANDAFGNYKYFRFSAGSFGCPAERGAFYVLGIADMETSNGRHPRSPGWTCPSRDFTNEMEFVIGRYEEQ